MIKNWLVQIFWGSYKDALEQLPSDPVFFALARIFFMLNVVIYFPIFLFDIFLGLLKFSVYNYIIITNLFSFLLTFFVYILIKPKLTFHIEKPLLYKNIYYIKFKNFTLILSILSILTMVFNLIANWGK